MIQFRLPRWPDRDKVPASGWQVQIIDTHIRPSLWRRIWRLFHG